MVLALLALSGVLYVSTFAASALDATALVQQYKQEVKLAVDVGVDVATAIPVPPPLTERQLEELEKVEMQRFNSSGWSKAGLCSTRDLQHFKDASEAYKRAQINATLQQERARMQRFNATVTKLLSPLRDASEAGLSLLTRSLRPTAVNLLRYGLEQMAKPRKAYTRYQQVNLTHVIEDDLYDALNITSQGEKATFRSAFTTLDAGLDQELNSTYARLATLFPHADEIPAADGIVNYITQKAMPVLLLREFPALAGLLLATRVHSEEDIPGFINGTLQPFVEATLPAACQSSELLEEVSDSGLDGMTSFLKECTAALGIEAPKSPPPKRECVTCDEHYQLVTLDPTNAESCVPSCAALAASCAQGLSDRCVGDIPGCLTCHRQKMLQLDTCKGTSVHGSSAMQLESLSRVFQNGTVEEAGVSDLVVKISEILIP